MPPRLYSRHSFVQQVDDGGESPKVFLTAREKYRYEPREDNIIHQVRGNESLHRLAARYYAALSDPPEFSAAQLWWVIADYQPQPIHDPTIKLAEGSTLIIPSLRAVQDRILNPQFRRSRGL